jgi:predicted AAA+ superfamily ATPase
MSLIKRFFPTIDESFFLFGPRGTGKSTLIQMNYKDALWINLLLPEVLRRFLGYPERLVDVITAHPTQSVIVIDEVQKAPQLLSVVHSLIEQKRGLQFILTGSSARKLKQHSANLLGGRALNHVLYPFMAAELGKKFSLSDALQNGMLPLLFNEAQPQNRLQAYISLYLHEEIQAEGLVRNTENFARFLEAITFSHASLLNTANIARECEVKRKTVENYIEILEDLLLAFRLPVFSKRAQRELSAHPKFYLFDAGVFYALRPRGPLDRPEEIQGAALEGLVAVHLKTWMDYSRDKYTLSFWRTRAGLEVDFVVYGEKGFWAIEVKNAKKVGFADTKALEAFLKDYPMAKAILLYRGDETIQQKNVLCIPVDEFLLQLRPGQSMGGSDGR